MITENQYIQWLAEARQGSRTGMGELARLVWDRLYPFVFRVTFNHDVTEDVLQETLLAMMCGVDGLREPARFWPWVYRIAWSKIQNHGRTRRMQSSAEASFVKLQPDREGLREDGDNPLDAQVRQEARQQVAQAVKRLPPSYQEVLHLHYYDQMPYTEIAQKTRTTPDHIRIRSFRAKRSLRSRLACCL